MQSLRVWFLVQLLGFLIFLWVLAEVSEGPLPDGVSVYLSPKPTESPVLEREPPPGPPAQNPWNTRGKSLRGDEYD